VHIDPGHQTVINTVTKYRNVSSLQNSDKG